MDKEDRSFDVSTIACIVFDFGFTLSSDLYFKVSPPEYPDWQPLIQQHIFSNEDLVNEWMKAGLTLQDIAEILRPLVGIEIPRIVEFLELGCERLSFNEAVFDFAVQQRRQGRKTAIVTGNMDVFTKVVVPCHHLADKFDIIINSFDYQELDKSVLWSRAFEILGNGIGYGQSLLIEDGAKNVAKFREHGGFAYQYENDERFLDWLKTTGW